jgi:hypothetical protein
VSRVGALNAYRCRSCGGVIATVDRHEGTTPMFLRCRAKDGCDGTMVSAMYPAGPPPAGLPPVAWEWYRPAEGALRRLKRSDPATHAHVLAGGLLLRPLVEGDHGRTDGATAIPAADRGRAGRRRRRADARAAARGR